MNDGCMSIDIIDQYRPSRLQGYNAKLHQFINISVFLRPDDVAPKNYYYFKKNIITAQFPVFSWVLSVIGWLSDSPSRVCPVLSCPHYK